LTEETQTEFNGFTLEEKAVAFWSKVDRSAGPDACWIWRGAVTSKHHYGCFSVAPGKVRGAHKIAWLLTNGDHKGLCVLHRCDNRVCVNPAHLFLGTKKDNMEDCYRKGRDGCRGESNVHAKLTEAVVRELRRDFKFFSPRKTNAKELGARYGINAATIYLAATGRTWGWLDVSPAPNSLGGTP